MRTGIKVFLILVVLGVLAVGLLPPLLKNGTLRNYASAGAQAGALAISNGASAKDVHAAVVRPIAGHHDVELVSIKTNHGAVTVVLRENVHSFMSGWPGLKGWFCLTVSESASELP